jgi:hypothetical protein
MAESWQFSCIAGVFAKTLSGHRKKDNYPVAGNGYAPIFNATPIKA